MTVDNAMHTGRLSSPLRAGLRERFFGGAFDESNRSSLLDLVTLDRATVICLAESGMCDVLAAVRFLDVLDSVECDGFAAFMGVPKPRGEYLAYEGVLASLPGGELAANLQRGRSRNDINATVTLWRHRRAVMEVRGHALSLMDVLANRVEDRSVVPLFTHGQPAVPTVVGHVLAAYAFQVAQHVDGLDRALDLMNLCPLGASAGAGAERPIDTVRLASLLGFEAPIPNSLFSVASRSASLEAAFASAMLCSTTARVCIDLFRWCSELPGFARLPDDLVGSSSTMPQKRNLFLFESVIGRAPAALSRVFGAASAVSASPFTNSFTVGTEAMTHLESVFADASHCLEVTGACLGGLEVVGDRMLDAANNSTAMASAIAGCLQSTGMSFREAHRRAGLLTSAAERLGVPLMRHAETELGELVAGLTAEREAAASEVGGGPGPRSMRSQAQALEELRAQLEERGQLLRRRSDAAQRDLADATRDLHKRAAIASTARDTNNA
jgi:argininosuccinate lyase